MSTITVEDLGVSIGNHEILYDVHYTSPVEGKLVGIMGPNGAGKSTLIKSMLGLIKHSGEALLDGMPISKQKADIAYVPQKSAIDLDFPITVEQVIQSGNYHSKDVDRLLERLELSHIKFRTLNGLSGGELQRVMVARSLMADKRIYILDEPFVGIDYISSEILTDVFMELKDSGKLIFIVHHDLNSARTLFDEIVLLNKTVIHVGPPHEVLTTERLEDTFFAGGEFK